MKNLFEAKICTWTLHFTLLILAGVMMWTFSSQTLYFKRCNNFNGTGKSNSTSVNINHKIVAKIENPSWKNTTANIEIPEEDRILIQTVDELNTLGDLNYRESITRMSTTFTNLNSNVFDQVLEAIETINETVANSKMLQISSTFLLTKENITIGVLACGKHGEQALVMLKTAIFFSLDSNLHAIVFCDKRTILNYGQEILALKLKLNKIGHQSFTFELHLESYPENAGDPDWRTMGKLCTTQRLFFPSLLKKHEALIYLDADTLVLSSLAEMWRLFRNKMGSTKMLGVTPNSELPMIYSPTNPLPYYEPHGINAGILLMNLTQMREFNFESRARAVYSAYKEKMILADQDIINAILHGFPDRALNMNCSYNFYWIHCKQYCYKGDGENKTNICFCNDVLESGVRILHGTSGTFRSTKPDFPVMHQTYLAFKDLNIFTDSYELFFRKQKKLFSKQNGTNCSPLTANLLYRQAYKYFNDLKIF